MAGLVRKIYIFSRKIIVDNRSQTRSDLNNRCARVCEKGPAANGRITLGCEQVRISVDKLTLIADEDKLKEFSMSDAEKLDAGKFLHANKGSTRGSKACRTWRIY